MQIACGDRSNSTNETAETSNRYQAGSGWVSKHPYQLHLQLQGLTASVEHLLYETRTVVRVSSLTLSWPGKIWFHPKNGCFNFKPQYLLNYTSPTNDLYSVRKRSIGAFKSIYKLLCLGPASAGPLCAKFFARSSPLACGFAALAPNFAPKLCTRRVSACFSACFKTCWGRFDPMLIPVG